MTTYAYDIECLKNLFTVTFVNVDDEGEKHVFCIGAGRDDTHGLNVFLHKQMTLVGYNNHSYDDAMLRYFMTYKGATINADLHRLSAKLISDIFRSDHAILCLRYPRNAHYTWDSIDLMKILAFDKLGISLKQTAINLKWRKIQDMPIHHDTNVTPEQVYTILGYNLNDVLITKRLYEELTEIRELRVELSKLYHVDLRSASDSKMANLILEHIYGTEMKMDMRTVKDMRTQREKVILGHCIADFIEFKSAELQELYDRISTTVVYSYKNFGYSEKLRYAGCNFALGIGGLHTEDEAGIFVSDDEYLIQDMDVASYYPNLIINNKFYPEHLGESFIKVLKKITEERISAKKAGDKVKADGLKITINSIFGKMGSHTFWLEDAKQMLSTTISGQLGLLMLVEALYNAGIPVISCNTDGVVCKIPRKLLDKYYEIANEWMAKSGLELEFTPYKKYVRRDVNSYITEKEDGKTKEKGAFVKKVDLKKSYHMPIVAQALYAYFIKGIPVKQTLEECKDIMQFCISQKAGSEYSIELHTKNGIEKLQKTNRFYITKKGGTLFKERGGSRTGLYVGRLVRILNDYDETTPFEDYNVDLIFYEKEVMKIVDEIEPKQTSLFDMSALIGGTKTKMEMPVKSKPAEVVEERITVALLNKLGSKQLARKLEDIVDNRQVVEKIGSRYLYIMDVDKKTRIANVYSLAKGYGRFLEIDKEAYKTNPLEAGNLIHCRKFGKNAKGEFTLLQYTETTDIREEGREFEW